MRWTEEQYRTYLKKQTQAGTENSNRAQSCAGGSTRDPACVTSSKVPNKTELEYAMLDQVKA